MTVCHNNNYKVYIYKKLDFNSLSFGLIHVFFKEHWNSQKPFDIFNLFGWSLRTLLASSHVFSYWFCPQSDSKWFPYHPPPNQYIYNLLFYIPDKTCYHFTFGYHFTLCTTPPPSIIWRNIHGLGAQTDKGRKFPGKNLKSLFLRHIWIVNQYWFFSDGN